MSRHVLQTIDHSQTMPHPRRCNPLGGPEWLQNLRAKGLADFDKTGLPHLKMEDWKYTDISPISNYVFSPVHRPAKPFITVNKFDIAVLSADFTPHRLVFLDGFYSPEMTQLSGLAPGIEVGSLAEAPLLGEVFRQLLVRPVLLLPVRLRAVERP